MEFTHDRGILGNIPGEFISRAMKDFPPPDDKQPAERKAEVDAGHLGRVRITYELSSSKHHKCRNWFWAPTFAERVAEP